MAAARHSIELTLSGGLEQLRRPGSLPPLKMPSFTSGAYANHPIQIPPEFPKILKQYTKGPFTCDVSKFLGFLDCLSSLSMSSFGVPLPYTLRCPGRWGEGMPQRQTRYQMSNVNDPPQGGHPYAAQGPPPLVRLLLPEPGQRRGPAGQGTARVPGAPLRVRAHSGSAEGPQQAGK